MTRRLLALLLIGHGLAHAAAGTWASAEGPAWIVTPLWWLATVGGLAAGLGLFGVSWLRWRWRPLATVAALASLLLLSIFGHPLFIPGVLIDVAVLAVLFWSRVKVPAPIEPASRGHRIGRRLGAAVAIGFLVHASAAVLLRPWHTSWGTTAADRARPLPGDVANARYRVDHAIVIQAPADTVWRWLVQIGQDRAGFYSYDGLERMIGADIRNVDEIRPAWQTRRVGELVRAVQPDYLGGALGRDVGWRVAHVDPPRALVLENWGTFAVEPLDGDRSLLHVRTRGEGRPTPLGIALSPIGLLVFEPAHFIMERGMLRGIRRRAERSLGDARG